MERNQQPPGGKVIPFHLYDTLIFPLYFLNGAKSHITSLVGKIKNEAGAKKGKKLIVNQSQQNKSRKD